MSLETFTALQKDFNSASEKDFSYNPQNIEKGHYSAQLSSDKIIGFHGDIQFSWTFETPQPCRIDPNILPLTDKKNEENRAKQFSFSNMLFTKSSWKNPTNDIYLDFSGGLHDLFNPPAPK